MHCIQYIRTLCLIVKTLLIKVLPITTTCHWLFLGFFKSYPCLTFLCNFDSLSESEVSKNSVCFKITKFAPSVFPIIVQPASQSHENSLLRCCFSLVWNKFLHRWTIQCLRITLLTINRDKEIQLHFSHGIPLSLDTSVKMHTSEPEWSFCLIVSLSTCGSFCQNYLISWHLQNIYTDTCFLKASWNKWPKQTKSV